MTVARGLAVAFVTAAGLTSPFAGQQNTLANSTVAPRPDPDVSALVPKGWAIETRANGDLNGDGFSDVLLALIEQQHDGDQGASENQNRRLVVALQTRTAGVRTIGSSDQLLLCTQCVGMFGSGGADLKISSKGVVSVTQMLGSNVVAEFTDRFRYDATRRRMMRIGQDIEVTDRTTGEWAKESRNLLTGRRTVRSGSSKVVRSDRISFPVEPLEDVVGGQYSNPSPELAKVSGESVVQEALQSESGRTVSRDEMLAAMRADLRNLVMAQEAFFSENQDYAGSIGPVQVNGVKGRGVIGFVSPMGSRITIAYEGVSGYSATATHPNVSETCGMYVGLNSPPNAALRTEGAPACWKDRAIMTHTVQMSLDQDQYRYAPATVRVRRGDIIRFINHSGGPHNVSFFADSIVPGSARQLVALMPDQMAPLEGSLLTEMGSEYVIPMDVPPGRYRFYCLPHLALGMKGVIVVSE
jgi:plastocyanin